MIAFDFTRPQAPKALSDIKVGGGKPWDLSDPFDSNGVVYFSYKYLGKLAPVGTLDDAADNLPEEPPSPRTRCHFLLRVDYADPAAPVINDTEINLPGELAGLARSAKLLFTIGQNYDLALGKPIAGESAFQVSAFDGVAAHLLDTFPLSSRNEPVSIQGETIFALEGQPEWLWTGWKFPSDGEPAVGLMRAIPIWGGGNWIPNPKKSVLSAWRLDEAGKFNKLGEIDAAHDTSLFVFGSLVTTQGDGRVLHLFDASNPTTIGSRGEFQFDGWVWPNLNHADGALDTGLWVPLGVYGVETIAIPAPAL